MPNLKKSEKSHVESKNCFQRPWSVFDEPSVNVKHRKFTHVSLFSGCGGFDLGFEQAGFKTVFANDIDSDACLTHKLNIGDISNEDITNTTIPTLKRDLDVLTAGFPCQPFSNAGLRKGLKDDRGGLYNAALNFIEKLTPKCVVFENVRGLVSFKLDNGKLLIGEICKELDKLGYNVAFSLINASHYHVPQNRLRVLIVGIRKDFGAFFSLPEPTLRDDLTLGNIVMDVKAGTYNQKELMPLSDSVQRMGDMVYEGGSWKDIPYNKLAPRFQRIHDNVERYRSPNFYRCFARDEVAGTITATFLPENAGVWHPTKLRILSVREVARIQSFPDWFKFEGSNIKSKYQQIGNAVPPRLAFELATHIKHFIFGKKAQIECDSITFNEFATIGKPLKVCDKNVFFT